jgi:hypothetical protein
MNVARMAKLSGMPYAKLVDENAFTGFVRPQSEKTNIVVNSIQAFLDESGTNPEIPVLSVAGLLRCAKSVGRV